MKNVKFSGSECKVSFGHYSNGNIHIQLYDANDYDPMGTATANIDVILEPGTVAIKDYSENRGMVKSLLDAGVIEKKVNCISNGYVTVPVYTLSEEAKKQIAEQFAGKKLGKKLRKKNHDKRQ